MNQKYNYNGELFLDALYKELHKEKAITKYKESKKESIKKYLDRIAEMHKRADTEVKKELVKGMYFRKYLPSEEEIENIIVPEGINKKDILESQKNSLTEWLDYLMNEDEIHPLWLKYLVFQSVLRMGTKNSDTGMYHKRSKLTTSPFPELNQEIVSKIMDMIEHYVLEKRINQEIVSYYLEKDPQFQTYIKNGNFSKLYAILENEYEENYHKRQITTEGEWKIYHQGSREDAFQLTQDLYHKSTGWCSANKSFAFPQICGPYSGAKNGGDFYVYYSKDAEGQSTVPRIAIRLIDHDRIGEIRGVNKKQHLEDSMLDILEKKLLSMNIVEKDKNQQLEKIHKLKKIIFLEEKVNKEEPLTAEELAFLYTNSFGFGWSNEPKVEKLIQKRNIMIDYEKITDINDKALMLSMHRSKFPHDFQINDIVLAKRILEFNYTCISLINPNIEGYNELINNTIEKHSYAINYINPINVENYFALAMKAIKQEYMVLEAIKIDALTTEQYKEIALIAVQYNPSMIKHINVQKLTKENYKNFLLMIGKKASYTILKIANFDIFTKEEYYTIIQTILEENEYDGIEYIQANKISKENYLNLYRKAIEKDPTLIGKVNTEIISPEDYKTMCLELIHKCNPMIINYINPQCLGESKNYKDLLLAILEKDTISLSKLLKIIFKNIKIGFLTAKDCEEIMKKIKEDNRVINKLPKEIILEGNWQDMIKEMEKIEELQNNSFQR